MDKTEIIIYRCTRAEFVEEAEKRNVDPWYGMKFLRGFYSPGEHAVFVEDNCPGFLALVAHEVGHALYRGHTKWPGIMNFSGLFRWFAFEPHDVILFVTQNAVISSLRGVYARICTWIVTRKRR